jgi:glycosyltransferase involved in cell wall biosynthesis
MQKVNYDVLHPTYYDPYLLKYRTKPLVITVHDMIHELFPEYFQSDRITVKNKKDILLNADKIIAISENTKKDTLELYPEIDNKKIAVIYHGISCDISDDTEKKENYLLYTGQRDGYKNFDAFIKAVAPLLLRYDLQLICTGSAFNKKEERLLKDLHVADRVVSRFVADDRLPGVYAKAMGFIFPSYMKVLVFPYLRRLRQAARWF